MSDGPETRPRVLRDHLVDLMNLLRNLTYDNRAEHVREAIMRIDEMEELLRLVHVDVVRATGVLVDLDEKIAAVIGEKTP